MTLKQRSRARRFVDPRILFSLEAVRIDLSAQEILEQLESGAGHTGSDPSLSVGHQRKGA